MGRKEEKNGGIGGTVRERERPQNKVCPRTLNTSSNHRLYFTVMVKAYNTIKSKELGLLSVSVYRKK